MLAVRTVSVVLGVGLVACSGASTPEIPPSIRGTETSRTEPPPWGSSNEPMPSILTDAGRSPPPPDDDDDDDEKPPRCASEVEPNDSAELATPFTSCISGKVASRKDTDHLRVAAPANATVMTIEHKETNGKLLYRVGRAGVFLPLDPSFTDEAPEIAVRPGGVYVFRVTFPTGNSGSDKKERGYELSVAFK